MTIAVVMLEKPPRLVQPFGGRIDRVDHWRRQLVFALGVRAKDVRAETGAEIENRVWMRRLADHRKKYSELERDRDAVGRNSRRVGSIRGQQLSANRLRLLRVRGQKGKSRPE